MHISFHPDQPRIRWLIPLAEARHTLRYKRRGAVVVGDSFEEHVRFFHPYGERHVSCGRFATTDEWTGETKCVLPYTYVEPEVGDLLDTVYAMRELIARLVYEEIDIDRMHMVYSGNASLWLGIPSAMLGNPIGSVDDQRLLRERIVRPLVEFDIDGALFDARQLHRVVGSQHPRGGLVQVLPAEEDFPLDWLNRDQPPYVQDYILRHNPYAGPPDDVLYQTARIRRHFYIPPFDEVHANMESSGFMQRTANGATEGARNWTAFRRACVHFDQQEMTRTEVLEALINWNEKCDPPLPRREVIRCIESAKRTIERKMK